MNNSSVRSFVPDLRPDKTIGRNLNCRKRRLDWSFIHIMSGNVRLTKMLSFLNLRKVSQETQRQLPILRKDV